MTIHFYCKNKRKRKILPHNSIYDLLPFFQLFSILQGWPMSDIGPSEALMLLCSYEECTRENIDPKKLESGELKLSESLTQEDFDMACLVSTFYLNHFVLLAPHLNLNLCPNLNQILPSSFSTINFSCSAATTCFFLPKQKWWTLFVPKFSVGILYVHCPSYLFLLVVGHNPTKGNKTQAEY